MAVLGIAGFASTAIVLAPLPAPPITCVWPIGDDTLPQVDSQWLTEMESAGSVNGLSPPRKPLAELTEAEWEDFRDALSIFRGGDKQQPVPATGYFALAAHHGSSDSDTQDRIGLRTMQGGKLCACNHDVTIPDAGPEKGAPPLFLLWHRAYIHAYELSLRSIMRYELAELRGAQRWRAPDWENFRLPYWDWSAPDDPGAARPSASKRRLDELARILEHFIPKDLSSTAQRVVAAPLISLDPKYCFTNPFHEQHRNTLFCQGKCDRDVIDFDRFSNPFLASSGIPFTQFNRRFFETWHQVVHVEVGAPDAGMAVTPSAAQDPLFWVHHANVDRLLMAWVSESSTHTDAAVPDSLKAKWVEAQVRFPVRVHGQLRVYTPSYEQLGTNAANSVMGYRYESLDHVTHGPIEEYKLSSVLKRTDMLACPARDPTLICPEPQSRSVLIGRAGTVDVPAGGAVVAVSPGAEHRKDLEASLRRSNSSAVYRSVYVGLRLPTYANRTLRKALGAQAPVALQLYVVPRLTDSTESGEEPTKVLPQHYLGSLDLFSEGPNEGWQYFGFRDSPAGASIDGFVREHGGRSWQMQLVILPIFRGSRDAENLSGPVVHLSEFGLAGRGTHTCPQLNDQCPLLRPGNQ